MEEEGEQGEDVSRETEDSRPGVYLLSIYQNGGVLISVVNKASSFDGPFRAANNGSALR